MRLFSPTAYTCIVSLCVDMVSFWASLNEEYQLLYTKIYVTESHFLCIFYFSSRESVWTIKGISKHKVENDHKNDTPG